MPHPPARNLTLLTTTRSVPTSAWSTLGQRLQDSVVTSVQRWATQSQRGSRRNAMVAGTALAQRRAERDEVEEFLAERAGSPSEVPPETRSAPASARDVTRAAHA